MAARIPGRTRVLLVDDNTGMLETLADILAAGGFEVETASDGAGALERLRLSQFDIAVFDIVLPDINGVELIRRALPFNPSCRYVAITAYTESELIDEARGESVADVLFKPIEPEQLLAVLRRLTASGS